MRTAGHLSVRTMSSVSATKSVRERIHSPWPSDPPPGILDDRINHDGSCPLQAPRPTRGPAPQLSLFMLQGADEAVALWLISLV